MICTAPLFGVARFSLSVALFLFLAFLEADAGSAQVAPEDIERLRADEVRCVGGTEMRYDESPDGSRSAMWCEMSRGAQVARHGPYLELFADGTTARQGMYLGGVQAGVWATWTPDGRLDRHRVVQPGEAGRFIPQPEDLCPQGSERRRSTGHDHKRRMWSQCHELNEEGERVLVGPYVTWDLVPGQGGARYALREIMTYENDRRHGTHQVFEGPSRRESLVEEETFHDGQPEGDSRAYFLDGTLREIRRYAHGTFDGERVGYFPNGTERWRIVYDQGREVSKEGDFTVANQPCPDRTVPATTADGHEDFCARRYLHFLERTGPFVRRDDTGRVVTSGLYDNGKIAELWQAPPGVELPPEVPDEVLVAEIQLMVGDRPYRRLNSQSPPEEPMESVPWMADDPETSRAEVEGLQATFDEAIEVKPTPEFDIWFKNNRTRKYPHPRTEVADGVVRVYGLPPGSYYMKVEIDAEPSNEMQWPGDLFSSTDFQVTLDEVTQAEGLLLHSLHLVEPWNNDEPIPGWGESCTKDAEHLSSLASFRWLAPAGEEPGSVEYHYDLTRYACDPRRKLEVIAKGETHDTSLSFELPPSKAGEVYEWSLIAKRDGRAIGQMMTFGEQGGYGWSLRFPVR